MLRKVSKEYDKMNYDMRADIERHTHHPRQEFQVDLSDNEDEAKADKIGDLLKEEAQQVTEAQWTTERVASWVSQLLTDHTRQRSTAIFLGFADMSTSTRGKMIIATYKNILVATIAQKLMTSIKDDKELIQHCTFVLANLCSEPSIRERLLTMGVVDTFISMVLKRKELNLATLRSVGYGLAACSLSVDAHSTFRSPQVLEGILELVDGVDTAVQFFGLVVIRNLSAYAKNWAPLLLQGVFNSLLSTMKAPDVLETTALMCAQVFQSLVANDHVKILVGTRTYLSTIAHEMTQTSNVVREELAALVSCISQVDATHINITDTDVIRPLLRCLSKKTSLGTHFHIAQVLANLSGNASTHTVFLEHGMLRRVLQLIYSLDEDIRLAAIRCVANLSNTAPLHPNLIQRGFLLCLPMYMINKDEPAW